MILRSATIALGVVVSLCNASALGQAQDGAQLPADLLRQPNLSPSQEDRVAAYVQAHAADLGSSDPIVAERARSALLDPLSEGVSAGFRIAYSGELTPRLDQLVGPGIEGRVVRNALRLAASLATDQSLRLIESSLQDRRPTVRYAAAAEAGAFLRNVQRGRAAIPRARVAALIDLMRDRLGNEVNPVVAQAFILALAARDAQSEPDFHDQAMAAMAQGAAEWLKFRRQAEQIDADAFRVALRAIEQARDNAINVLAQGGDLDPQFGRAAARVGGQALAMVRDLLQRGADGEAELRLAKPLAKGAETLLTIVHGALANEQVQVETAAAVDAVGRLGQRPATQRAVDALESTWIGPTARLNRPPYDFPAQDFD